MALLRGHWQLLALTAAVFALWQTPAVVPLKVLIVFFHEASHAIATLLTGGDVVSLSVSPDQGGLVISRGGNRFITLSAGYLGSLIIGVALLLAATRTVADRKVMALCGVVTLVIAGLYVRDVFALAFCVGMGAVMLLMARFMGHNANDLALRIIGLTSMIYVPYDIFSDTIARASLRSDARMLAEEFGGTTMMWGGLWLIVSLAVIAWCLRRGLGRNSNLRLR
ncbi:peptidase M50B-like protein [Loktanella sp. PT4BL]|uniref:M50 family metallopeptidase n=1 Tax=Loktanella sp. PT4BL TaxID=2135611 RepID=UPI000D759EF7|nr:M50 family metallopeptidase [Loktanella sp. PT4BL]PXW68680.1 peptidase M50B-like protein [Loktanella sp. PT4BL]